MHEVSIYGVYWIQTLPEMAGEECNSERYIRGWKKSTFMKANVVERIVK
jgi:hypothetical protein